MVLHSICSGNFYLKVFSFFESLKWRTGLLLIEKWVVPCTTSSWKALHWQCWEMRHVSTGSLWKYIWRRAVSGEDPSLLLSELWSLLGMFSKGIKVCSSLNSAGVGSGEIWIKASRQKKDLCQVCLPPAVCFCCLFQSTLILLHKI